MTDNATKKDSSGISPQVKEVLSELLATLDGQATHILTSLGKLQPSVRQEGAVAIKEEASPAILGFVKKVIQNSDETLLSIHAKRQQIERIHTSVRYLQEQLTKTNNIFEMDLLTDTLTGTYSRFAMDHLLKKIMASTDENGEHKKIVLAIANIDFLSKINNEYGQEWGDNVLKHFGQTANLVLRNTDYVLRYAGDEFLLIMTETDLSNSRIAAERIRDQLKKTPLVLNDKQKTEIIVKFSAGVAPLRWDGLPEYAIENVLSALDTAKKSGRNCIKIAAL